ncbi:MAG: O-antigen ligase family protein, partial [Bacteroidales bacterium]|nr:O-antigen ligase family protein [Bacteroidales bacterium]
MMTRITQFLFGAALVALFSTVCIVDASLWRGAVTGKYFWFASAMCLAVPLWCIRMYRNPQGDPVIRSADIAFAAFAVYAVLRHVLTEGIGGGMHWYLFLLMIPLYAMIRSLSGSRNMTALLTGIIVVFAFVEAVWGILQLCGWLPSYHRGFRITGSLFNPGPYAGFIAVCVPLALSLALDRTVISGKRWPGIVALVVMSGVLPFTGSRAAWLAALAGSAVVLWTVFGERVMTRIPRNRRVAGMIVGTAVVLALLYGAYHLKKDSANGRWLIWKVTASMIGEHPLFGTGQGRFAAVYPDAQADWFAAGKGSEAEIAVAGNPAYAFNEWLHIAVELGITGLFVFGLAVLLCLGVRWSGATATGGYGNNRYTAYRASLLSFCVFASFSYPFDVLPLSMLFTVLAAATASDTRALRRQPGFRNIWPGMALCVVMTGIVSSGILRNRPYYADWREAHNLLLGGSYHDALEEYGYLHD